MLRGLGPEDLRRKLQTPMLNKRSRDQSVKSDVRPSFKEKSDYKIRLTLIENASDQPRLGSIVDPDRDDPRRKSHFEKRKNTFNDDLN